MKEKFIQMVVISENLSVFILDYDEKTGEITTRNTYEPKFKYTEPIFVDENNNVHIKGCFFNVGFLQNFIKNR